MYSQEKKQKEVLTRKQEKNRGKTSKGVDDNIEPTQLLQKPRDYNVKFSFPDPSPLQPPILGLHSKLSIIIVIINNSTIKYVNGRCEFCLSFSKTTV